jgi:hypothetical protein
LHPGSTRCSWRNSVGSFGDVFVSDSHSDSGNAVGLIVSCALAAAATAAVVIGILLFARRSTVSQLPAADAEYSPEDATEFVTFATVQAALDATATGLTFELPLDVGAAGFATTELADDSL